MKNFYDKDFSLGILGGGQLGRMFIQDAISYNVNVAVLDPALDAPCAKIAHEFVCGDFNDYQTVIDFGSNRDVLTIEIEHVNVDALEELEKRGVKVFPQSSVLRIVQDKGLQKQFFIDNNIPSSPFYLIEKKSDVITYRSEFPFMQKARRGGYDGRGVTPLRNEEDEAKAFDCPSVLEKMVDFEKELSVIVSRNERGEVKAFPLVELDFNEEANLVDFLFSPANVSSEIEKKAIDIGIQTAEAFGCVGLLAVELFLTREGEILVNEVAPRTHNSGHHSIEGNVTSQFEQHLRSVVNMPLGDTNIVRPAVMVNLLGEKGFTGPAKYEGLNEVTSWSGVYVHLYGKTNTKPFRKMGHVTVTSEKIEDAFTRAKEVKNKLRIKA